MKKVFLSLFFCFGLIYILIVGEAILAQDTIIVPDSTKIYTPTETTTVLPTVNTYVGPTINSPIVLPPTTDTTVTPVQNTIIPTDETTKIYSTSTVQDTTLSVVEIEPQNPTIYVGDTITFKTMNNGRILEDVSWTVAEEGGGSIDDSGVYTAPNMAGVFHIITRVINNITQTGQTTIMVRLKPVITDPKIISPIIATTSVVDEEITEIKLPVINPTTTSTVIVPVVQVPTTITTSDFATTTNVIKTTIPTVIKTIKEATTSAVVLPPNEVVNTIQTTVNTFEAIQKAVALDEQVEAFKKQGGDLLYKDSNNDGVSDYDSVYVYNIDPVKTTPVVVIGDKKINAAGKILLGYSPKETDLVKVKPEEPNTSLAKEVSGYKLEKVELTPDKKVMFTGRALPNSFVTIYIYSTPIIVTVRTNALGEWNYTLDQELDDGQHKIYTATVNNTGKILAKSSGFTFTKTASAAVLESLPPVQVVTDDIKPGILSGNNLYVIIFVFMLIILLSLVIIGIGSRKNIQQF